MRELVIALVGSALMHGLIFFFANRLEIRPPNRQPPPIRMKVVDVPQQKPKPPPPPAPKPPEPEVEKPKPEPKPKKPMVRAPLRKDDKQKVEEPKPSEEPPPPKPKPPPMGFSVDMSATSMGGGVTAPATEGGGNMFADPSDNTLAPGKKTSERTPPASGEGTGPGRGDIVVTMPSFKTPPGRRIPPYPDQARRNDIEGQVILRVYIGASGLVEKVKIVQKLGYGCDEAAAEHAKKRWRFEPGTRGGVAEGMWITVPVKFVLER